MTLKVETLETPPIGERILSGMVAPDFLVYLRNAETKSRKPTPTNHITRKAMEANASKLKVVI